LSTKGKPRRWGLTPLDIEKDPAPKAIIISAAPSSCGREMKSTVMVCMVTLVLVSTLTVAFNIRPIKASGTIFIRADGGIDPPTANITTTDNVTYVFTGNISAAVIVERSHITIDGAGYALQGAKEHYVAGFDVTGRNNVTIRNTRIRDFHFGIVFLSSSGSRITGNTMADNIFSIYLEGSSDNSVFGNSIINSYSGIWLIFLSNNNRVSGNTITGNSLEGVRIRSSADNIIIGNNVTNNGKGEIGNGIALSDSSSNNTVSGNNITDNVFGISLGHSNYNTIVGNNVADSHYNGITLSYSSENVICHNNFLNNLVHTFALINYYNTWEGSYPSGGNYWSGHADVDVQKGEYQNETGGDGVWDHPYPINGQDPDRFPLTTPINWFPPGDVDGDRDVDIFDIASMTGVYGVDYPDPRYDRLCDMDLDGDVDIFDMVKAAGNYGQSW
jgi:parallel beta-helix repeat protein